MLATLKRNFGVFNSLSVNVIRLGQNLAGLSRIRFFFFRSSVFGLHVVFEDGELAAEDDGEEEKGEDDENENVEDEQRSIKCHLNFFCEHSLL